MKITFSDLFELLVFKYLEEGSLTFKNKLGTKLFYTYFNYFFLT